MPSIVHLMAVDPVGQHRIEVARTRLKKNWDGKGWAVTELPVPKACPGRIYVRPDTQASTDWLGFWVDVQADPYFRFLPS